MVQETPFPDSTFRGVVAYEVFEHLSPEDGEKMLGELYRIIKPGGCLLLSTINDLSLDRRVSRLLGRKEKPSLEEHFNEISYLELQENIEKTGFIIERLEGVGIVPLMWRMQRFLPFPLVQDWNIAQAKNYPQIASETLVIAIKPDNIF